MPLGNWDSHRSGQYVFRTCREIVQPGRHIPQIERLDLIRYVTGFMPDGVRNHSSDFNDECDVSPIVPSWQCATETNPSCLDHVQRCVKLIVTG
jgi:hypothetical protein